MEVSIEHSGKATPVIKPMNEMLKGEVSVLRCREDWVYVGLPEGKILRIADNFIHVKPKGDRSEVRILNPGEVLTLKITV